MPLYFGRDKNAGVSFQQDMLMSRFHLRFDFTNDSWSISDGDGDEKSSGNGTWIFCDLE